MVKKYGILSLALLAFPVCSFSQFVNEGELYVATKTILSVHFDAINREAGDYVNDGNIYYHKNLYNNGLITFTPAIGGSTFFVGTENQIIQTELESEFFNLYFENYSQQPAFQLDGNISIENRTVFTSGIVNSAPFGGTVRFNRYADYLNASDDSYIGGKVAKTGYDSFVFPIGDEGFLRPLELSSTSDQNASSQYFFENSNAQYPHASKNQDISIIDNAEYWNIDVLTGQSVIMTLGWRNETTPIAITDPLDGTALQVVGWNESVGKWERKFGTADTETQKITALIDRAGIYTLARVTVKEAFPADIIIYNGMSPNDDGRNDTFHIEGIEKYPRNSIEIYNRWGALVFETKGYGISGNWFRGISQGDITVNKGEKLPSGTYFYIIKLKATHGNTVDTTGYLYIN